VAHVRPLRLIYNRGMSFRLPPPIFPARPKPFADRHPPLETLKISVGGLCRHQDFDTPIPNVQISFIDLRWNTDSGYHSYTDVNGRFEATLPDNGTGYTVKPCKYGWGFTPGERTISGNADTLFSGVYLLKESK
jgi:hypothetical protein